MARRVGLRAGLLAASLTLLVGCGGADPAAVRDLASDLADPGSGAADGSATSMQATCRAQVFLESDLSTESLESLRKTGQPTAKTKHDREELAKVADRITKECL